MSSLAEQLISEVVASPKQKDILAKLKKLGASNPSLEGKSKVKVLFKSENAQLKFSDKAEAAGLKVDFFGELNGRLATVFK